MDLNLPCNFTYFHVKNEEDIKNFRIKEIKDAESAKAWIGEFSNLNFITWRVLKTYPNSKNRDYIYRKDFRCQHFTDRRAAASRSSKNTDCPSKLIIKIDRLIESSDSAPEMIVFPASISILKKHNHPVMHPDNLKFRDMSEESKTKLRELFRQGHNPSSALHCLKTDLIFEHGDEYYKIAADGAYLPSLSKTYKLFNKEFKDTYGDVSSGTGWFKNAEESPRIEHMPSAEVTPEAVEIASHVERQEKLDSISSEELKEFDNLIQQIKTGLERDPSSFIPAFKKMIHNYKTTASTDSGLVSAMHTFGLYIGIQSTSQNKAKQLIRHSHKTIMGVQPTAISRRKYLLSGRKKLNVGRPVSSFICPPELRSHDCTSLGVLLKRKHKAPHNLSHCVEDNKSLGSSNK